MITLSKSEALSLIGKKIIEIYERGGSNASSALRLEQEKMHLVKKYFQDGIDYTLNTNASGNGIITLNIGDITEIAFRIRYDMERNANQAKGSKQADSILGYEIKALYRNPVGFYKNGLTDTLAFTYEGTYLISKAAMLKIFNQLPNGSNIGEKKMTPTIARKIGILIEEFEL